MYLVFLVLMNRETGFGPVCLVVFTLLPWRSHTLKFCLLCLFVVCLFAFKVSPARHPLLSSAIDLGATRTPHYQ
jgi:hypothetical protein